MSKRRELVQIVEGELETPEEGDAPAFVVFTQLKADGPYIYAGWLDAVDVPQALQYAREHYGQDQKCVHLCVIPRTAIAGTEPEHAPSDEPAGTRTYQVFREHEPTQALRSAETIEAGSPAAALRQARGDSGAWVWVVPVQSIAGTDDDDLIWRYSDQDYRLARGYAQDVREKWEKVRAERDIDEYEKEDLKETF